MSTLCRYCSYWNEYFRLAFFPRLKSVAPSKHNQLNVATFFSSAFFIPFKSTFAPRWNIHTTPMLAFCSFAYQPTTRWMNSQQSIFFVRWSGDFHFERVLTRGEIHEELGILFLKNLFDLFHANWKFSFISVILSMNDDNLDKQEYYIALFSTLLARRTIPNQVTELNTRFRFSSSLISNFFTLMKIFWRFSSLTELSPGFSFKNFNFLLSGFSGRLLKL